MAACAARIKRRSRSREGLDCCTPLEIPVTAVPLPDLNNLDIQRAMAVANAFGIDCVQANPVVGGFSGSRVYRVVDRHHSEFAVRLLSPDPQANRQPIQTLHDLQAFLIEQGLSQIAKPVTVKSEYGHPYPLVTNSTLLADTDGLWQAETWMPGCGVAHSDLTERRLRNAMTLLNQFHTCAATFAARYPNCDRFQLQSAPSPALQRRLEIIAQLADGQLTQLENAAQKDKCSDFGQLSVRLSCRLRSCLPELQQRCQDLRRHCFLLQPVIRDLWSAHILFLDDQVSGLIDLHASGTDHVTTDLARLIRSWLGSDHERILELIGVFETFRTLSSTELSLLSVLDECNVVLSPVTWMKRRYLPDVDAEAPPDNVMHRFSALVDLALRFRRLRFPISG